MRFGHYLEILAMLNSVLSSPIKNVTSSAEAEVTGAPLQPLLPASSVPHVVLVPPSVVLQHNQSEVEVNCSTWSSKRPLSLQWIVISTFKQNSSQDFRMLEINGPIDINPCVAANVTQIEEEANISRLNLILRLAKEDCFEAIQQGQLYLRGLCLASNDLGTASETFELDVISNQNQV